MKAIQAFLLLFLSPTLALAQIQGEDEVYLGGDRIEAKFKGGGIDKFSEFIHQEFDYSKVTKAGKMEATFTVDEKGNVAKIRISQMLDVESATEFIRVLKMCPKWEPASRGGKPISIEIKYPMVFRERARKEPKPQVKQEPQPATSTQKEPGDELYSTAAIDRIPDFPGGMKAFYEYIGKNFNRPDVKGLGGKVITTFIIEKDGSLTDIKVLRDIGHGTKEEAIKVLQNSPKWIPGEQSGKKVRVLYSLPIVIQPQR